MTDSKLSVEISMETADRLYSPSKSYCSFFDSENTHWESHTVETGSYKYE